MPRAPRITSAAVVHHVISRGNNKNTLFRDKDDFLAFLNILAYYQTVAQFRLFHFVLMSNHFHFLLQPNSAMDLSAFMQRIIQAYSWYFKKRYDFCGQLWQGRFKNFLVENDEYLLTCGIYIELNPVRAGIVNEPEHYPWSSCRQYLGMKMSSEILVSLDPDPAYLSLAKDEQERRTIYKELLTMWKLIPRKVPGTEMSLNIIDGPSLFL